MPAIENLTPFGAVAVPSMNRAGAEGLLVLAAARFDLSPPGVSEQPTPSAKQPAPPLADEYWGEPGASSVRVASQSAYTKSGADLYLTAHACAPAGRPVKAMRVSLRLGQIHQSAVVFGDRLWEGRSPTPATPFTRMPLRWERAFGGHAAADDEEGCRDFESRNPIGRGFYSSARAARGCPLPNIERSDALIRSPTDRPEPIGFGPTAPAWQPRQGFGGSYDETWLRERAPFWPDDLDPRFFCAAAPGLCAPEPWAGGEPLRIEGVHSDGALECRLPAPRLRLRIEIAGRTERIRPTLDTVDISVDELHLTLTFRHFFACREGLHRLSRCSLRELSSWEPS